jgi:AcrR family transcriptional regulator
VARPRASTYDEQRAQILRAAAALFAQRGYTAATMASLSRASGVSKATLYHYFTDKEQLLEQVARDHVQRLEALVRDVQAQQLSPQEHLRELIHRFMAAYAGAADAHRVLTEDIKFLQAPARQGVEDAQRRVVQAFADAVAKVRPGTDESWHKPLAMLLFGMINWTFTWLKPEGPLTHAALAPVVVELFTGGLAALSPTTAGPPAVRPGRRASPATAGPDSEALAGQPPTVRLR